MKKERGRESALQRWLYLWIASAIFLGAFLLFQVQPMIARYLLPWFGGSATTWSVCMLFFQAALLAGYAYAHGSVRWLSGRTQSRVHLAVLLLSAVVLATQTGLWGPPVFPGPEMRPPGEGSPAVQLLLILLVSLGLPGLILASASPLMQAWYGRIAPARSPYRLYALSNAGSLIALVTYPFIVEPLLSLRTQAVVWSVLFVAFLLVSSLVSLALRFGVPLEAWAAEEPKAPSPRRRTARPGIKRMLAWLAFAAAGSVMLLATTNQLSRDVAAVPFLWVAPLALYLLSYILTFSHSNGYSRGWWIPILAVACVGALFVLWEPFGAGIVVQGVVYGLVLMASCMVCHGELVRLRPVPEHLTSFYLMVALGGAIGGVFVSIAAPGLMDGLWEFQIGLVAVWFLLAAALAMEKPTFETEQLLKFGKFGALGTGCLLAALLYAAEAGQTGAPVRCNRSFYGLVRVYEFNAEYESWHLYALYHGSTKHGLQFRHDSLRNEPASYYAEDTGIGIALLFHPKKMRGVESLRIGVIGMGTATIAAYAEQGDSVRFYEINQDVIDLSLGEDPVFTYAAECAGDVEVVRGDGRLSLERELDLGGSQQFDVFVLDAFNSDAIPLHLLTREALQVYLAHLGTEGIIAVHISNRYLDLKPVLYRLADELGLVAGAMEVADVWTPGCFPSEWMLMTRDGRLFRENGLDAFLFDREMPFDSAALWTDDYANLLGVVRVDALLRGDLDEGPETEM